MKEIKYRVFDTTTDTMYYPGKDGTQLVIGMTSSDAVKNYIALWSDEGEICREDEAKFIQYTGLKDKNGVEIYEGDIGWDEHQEIHGVVEYDEGKFIHSEESVCEDLFEVSDSIVVVGNIYKNPELLEVRNNREIKKM